MESFIKYQLEMPFKSDAIRNPTLFKGFGIGNWDVLITPQEGCLKFDFVKTKISGSSDSDILYRVSKVLATRMIRIAEPSIITVGNAHQNWWVQSIPETVWRVAEEKGVNIRIVRTVTPLQNETKASLEATEWLRGNWSRLHSHQWSEPINGFGPEEGHFRGHYRGVECNGLNGYWGEYVFSRSVSTERILEFLMGLK